MQIASARALRQISRGLAAVPWQFDESDPRRSLIRLNPIERRTVWLATPDDTITNMPTCIGITQSVSTLTHSESSHARA